jgi:hypothetical protein
MTRRSDQYRQARPRSSFQRHFRANLQRVVKIPAQCSRPAIAPLRVDKVLQACPSRLYCSVILARNCAISGRRAPPDRSPHGLRTCQSPSSRPGWADRKLDRCRVGFSPGSPQPRKPALRKKPWRRPDRRACRRAQMQTTDADAWAVVSCNAHDAPVTRHRHAAPQGPVMSTKIRP